MRQKGNVRRIAAIYSIYRENRTIVIINNAITLVRGASVHPQSNRNIQYRKTRNLYFKKLFQAGICTEMTPDDKGLPADLLLTAISFCSDLSAHCVIILCPSIITILLYRKSVHCHQRLIISATVKITERGDDGLETEKWCQGKLNGRLIIDGSKLWR
jgi:hypothetical protein